MVTVYLVVGAVCLVVAVISTIMNACYYSDYAINAKNDARNLVWSVILLVAAPVWPLLPVAALAWGLHKMYYGLNKMPRLLSSALREAYPDLVRRRL